MVFNKKSFYLNIKLIVNQVTIKKNFCQKMIRKAILSDLNIIKKLKYTIMPLALIGTVFSTLIIGFLTFWIFNLLGQHYNLITCLNKVRFRKMDLGVILWPPASEIFDEICAEIEKTNEIVSFFDKKVPKESFKGFLYDIYKLDYGSLNKINSKHNFVAIKKAYPTGIPNIDI